MPVRVAFDNNFLDKFHAADDATREAIYRCVDLGQVEVFATREMIRELFGMAMKPETRWKVPPFASYVLRLSKGTVLNPMLHAQESELRGSFELLMSGRERDEMVRYLEEAATGNILSEAERIGREALEEKKLARQWFRDWHTDITARTKEQTPEERAASTFERVQDLHWQRTGRQSVRRACERFGIELPEQVAERVFADPASYPHFRFHMRIFNVMTHRYFIEAASKERGDLYDLWQMTYMVDMDIFVTNEGKLPEWYRDAFGEMKRVLTADAFLSQAWC